LAKLHKFTIGTTKKISTGKQTTVTAKKVGVDLFGECEKTESLEDGFVFLSIAESEPLARDTK
jgi:hypothetical protein